MDVLTGAREITAAGIGVEASAGAAGDLDLSPRGVEVRLDDGDDAPDQLGTRGSALPLCRIADEGRYRGSAKVLGSSAGSSRSLPLSLILVDDEDEDEERMMVVGEWVIEEMVTDGKIVGGRYLGRIGCLSAILSVVPLSREGPDKGIFASLFSKWLVGGNMLLTS